MNTTFIGLIGLFCLRFIAFVLGLHVLNQFYMGIDNRISTTYVLVLFLGRNK